MARRAPPGRINGKVFARRHGAEVHGRLMERWKAEGTYFANRGKIPLSAFAGDALVHGVREGQASAGLSSASASSIRERTPSLRYACER